MIIFVCLHVFVLQDYMRKKILICTKKGHSEILSLNPPRGEHRKGLGTNTRTSGPLPELLFLSFIRIPAGLTVETGRDNLGLA
jgi:hypothetical protein